MNLAHVHLLLNHWPIIGTYIALGLLVVALIWRSDDLKQGSLALLAFVALLALPAYLSGNAAADTIKKLSGYPVNLVNTHEGAALLALLALEITGVFALWGLWQFSRGSKIHAAAGNTAAVLILTIVTAGLMTVAGTTGGDIRHPEILAKGEASPAVATMGAQWILSLRYFVIDYSRWVWPALETLHFVGLILLVGTVGIVSVRLLGFLKKLPVAPLHRLLPWGIAGFAINIVTGFMFFVGMPFFYTFNEVFQAKIAAILLAGAILLFFYCTGTFRKWGALKADENAPAIAKLIALSSIVLWIVVVVIGRYIPLGESAQ